MTTTKQISDVLSNNLLQVTNAEVYYKTSRKTDIITDTFLENFQFLCESGCFMDRVGWHYEKDYIARQYIIESGSMDGDSEIFVIIHLCVNDNAKVEDIDKALKMMEEE